MSNLEFGEVKKEQTDADFSYLLQPAIMNSTPAWNVVESDESSVEGEEELFRAIKRRRTSPREPEFTIGELCVLTRYLVEHYEVIHGLVGEGGRSADGKKSKDELLQQMSAECTALGEATRTPQKCAQKLRNIMNNVKKYANIVRNEQSGVKVDKRNVNKATIGLFEVLSRNPRVLDHINGIELYDQINDKNNSSSLIELPAKLPDWLESGQFRTLSPHPLAPSSLIREKERYESARISALEAERKRSEAQEKAANAERILFETQTTYWRRKMEAEGLRSERDRSRFDRDHLPPRAYRGF